MLVSFWMIQKLTREINTLQKKMLDKHTELEHYTKYSGRLGSAANLGISNIAGLSPDILPRASVFAQYSDQVSSMSAMQNLQMMKMMGRVPYTGNYMVDMQIQMSAYTQFKQEALKELKRQEIAVMNEKEKEIELELNSIKQQLEIKKQQLEAYKKQSEEDAKKYAPNFG